MCQKVREDDGDGAVASGQVNPIALDAAGVLSGPLLPEGVLLEQ